MSTDNLALSLLNKQINQIENDISKLVIARDRNLELADMQSAQINSKLENKTQLEASRDILINNG